MTLDQKAWGRTEAHVAIALAILFALVFAATASLTGTGPFLYSLDDTYIHLAVAEEILAGNYGINPGEAAAASSSPLYPFLLAGLLALGLGTWAPLALNALATALSLRLAFAIWRAAGLALPQLAIGRASAIGIVFVLALNLVGLAFTGMEHSLQTTLALAALLGLVRFAARGRVDAWWIVVLIAQTAIRYEGLAIAAAGALALILARRFAIAGLVVAGGVGILAAFGAFLVSLGLPPAPSSVLVKGGDVATSSGIGGRLSALAENAIENLTDRPGILFLMFAIGFACVALRPRGVAAEPAARIARSVGLFVGAVVLAHLLVGRFGWGQRYEAYALTLAMVALPAAFPLRFAALAAGRDAAALTVALVVTAMAFERNVQATLESATGARNVYLQQYQMHRLAVDYLQAPVAVNDLGWVSFRNRSYVLDLWGLGSERARRARLAKAGPDWMDALARERGVKAALIYDSWLPERPARWVKLGELRQRGKLVTISDRTVAVYAIDPADAPALRAKLDAWAATLPKRATFTPAP